MLMKLFLISLSVFLLFVVVLHFLTDAGGHGWKTYCELERSGRLVNGQVTRAEPRNHQRVYYSFKLGANDYEGAEDGHNLTPGSEVRIIYLLRDPTISCLRDPGAQCLEQIVFVLVASVALAFAVTFGIWRVRRRPIRKDASLEAL